MIDLTPLLAPVLQIAGIAASAVIGIYFPKAIAAFEARTHVQLTDQQVTAIRGAIATSAGILETQIDQGVLSVAHIQVGSPAVEAQAQALINAVPRASAALGLSIPDVARMIVGAVDTGSRTAAPGATQGTPT